MRALFGGALRILIILIVGGALFFMNAVRIVQEYERGVIFRHGRLVGARGPGLFLLIPSGCKRSICGSSR